jgi:hypothetical protein
VHVQDLTNKQWAILLADLKVKMARAKDGGDGLTAIERTIVLCKTEIDSLRQKRMAAKAFVRYVAEVQVLVWPDEYQNLHKLRGTLMDAKTGIDREVSFTSYMTTGLHLQVTVLLYGPAGVGKTPLCESAAARMAASYQDTNEYYIITSTPDSLRRVSEEGLMVSGVPIILDELDAADSKQHRSRLSANFVKQLTGVRTGGVVGARYQDFAFPPGCPRLVSSNAETMQEWLDGVTDSPVHQAAIKKRVLFVHVPEQIVPDAADASMRFGVEAQAAAGAMRLAKKLGRPM